MDKLEEFQWNLRSLFVSCPPGIASRVIRGVQLLKHAKPGWWELVDEDLFSCHYLTECQGNCIPARVYKTDCVDGVKRLSQAAGYEIDPWDYGLHAAHWSELEYLVRLCGW